MDLLAENKVDIEIKPVEVLTGPGRSRTTQLLIADSTGAPSMGTMILKVVPSFLRLERNGSVHFFHGTFNDIEP